MMAVPAPGVPLPQRTQGRNKREAALAQWPVCGGHRQKAKRGLFCSLAPSVIFYSASKAPPAKIPGSTRVPACEPRRPRLGTHPLPRRDASVCTRDACAPPSIRPIRPAVSRVPRQRGHAINPRLETHEDHIAHELAPLDIGVAQLRRPLPGREAISPRPFGNVYRH